MTRATFLLTSVCVVVAVIGLAVAGCQRETPGGTAAAHGPVRPSPEESFQHIADTFRRTVDTNVSGHETGYLYREGAGHSRLSIRNEVSDELIPPTKPGEPYRGTITVDSHYTYSLYIPESPSDSGDKKDGSSRSNGDATSSGDSAADASGVQVLDPNLAAAANKSVTRSNGTLDDVIARRSDEDVRTYELQYEGDRWVLRTKLDPNTEQSIQSAFEHALATQ